MAQLRKAKAAKVTKRATKKVKLSPLFVVYKSRHEVLVTTPSRERLMHREWFSGVGRDSDEFDRYVVVDDAVWLTTGSIHLQNGDWREVGSR